MKVLVSNDDILLEPAWGGSILASVAVIAVGELINYGTNWLITLFRLHRLIYFISA